MVQLNKTATAASTDISPKASYSIKTKNNEAFDCLMYKNETNVHELFLEMKLCNIQKVCML